MKIPNSVTETPVSEWMTRNVVTIRADDTIQEAVVLMQENQFTTIPVVGSQGECIGILSRSDLTELFLTEDEELSRLSDTPRLSMEWYYRTLETCDDRYVKELMTHDVLTINMNDRVSDACQAFVSRSIHHLPVVDENNRVTGMFSTFDVIKAISDHNV